MVTAYIYLNRALDFLSRPLERLPQLVPLVFWSAVVGVVAMLIYKYASNQEKIKEAKEKIKGHFLEVFLYIDDAAVIAKAQSRIMANAFRYLGYAMPPLIIMIIIFFPLFANLETRWAMRPLKPGEQTLVKVRLSEPFDGWEEALQVETPSGISVVGYPVRLVRRIKKEGAGFQEKRREYELDLKLMPKSPGRHEIAVKSRGSSFTVPLFCGGDYGQRVAPVTTTRLGTALLFPPMNSIPADSRVESVFIQYPEADFNFLGWKTWWVWPFLIVSVVAALLVKGIFKVEI